MFDWIFGVIDSAVGAFAPRMCAVCQNGGSILCARCKPTPNNLATSNSFHLWEYSHEIAKIITAAKYKKNHTLCSELGDILGVSLKNHLHSTNSNSNYVNSAMVVPIPTSFVHLRERGFSHTGIIGARVANHLAIPLAFSGLKYTGSGIAQVGLTNQERAANIHGAFQGNKRILKNRSVLLIDDIVTTGSTIIAAKKALLTAGASDVFIATIALVRDRQGGFSLYNHS